MQGVSCRPCTHPLSHNLGVCASRLRNNACPKVLLNPTVRHSDATFQLTFKNKKKEGKGMEGERERERETERGREGERERI